MLAYSRMGRTSVVYARCLVLRGHVRMFLWRKADVAFALCAVLLMWVFQFRVLLIWIPRYFAVSVVWRLWLCMVYVDLMILRLLVMCIAWHFCGWKCMSQSDSHLWSASRSSWREIVSCRLVMGR